MLYKSRNGIGIRVILITLFFFFMLTDAKPNDSKPTKKELSKECAKFLCLRTNREVNTNFEEATSKEEIEQLAESVIKEIKKIVDNSKDGCKVAKMISFVLIVILSIFIFSNELRGCGWSGKIIFIVLAFLWLVFLVCANSQRHHQDEACRNLERDIKAETKLRIDVMLMEILIEDAEKAEIERIPETKVKAQSEEIKFTEEKDAGKKEVSEVEKNEFSEETKISMESAITITDTSSSAEAELETYYEDYSVTSEFNASNKKHKKKDEKKGCLLDNIDLNRFVYAMILVFALFAIYTFCNFEEEEETREITEV